jgi:hypothetical protein
MVSKVVSGLEIDTNFIDAEPMVIERSYSTNAMKMKIQDPESGSIREFILRSGDSLELKYEFSITC